MDFIWILINYTTLIPNCCVYFPSLFCCPIFHPCQSFSSPHPCERGEEKRTNWELNELIDEENFIGEKNIIQRKWWKCACVCVCVGKQQLIFDNPNHDEGACYNAFSPDPSRKIRNFLTLHEFPWDVRRTISSFRLGVVAIFWKKNFSLSESMNFYLLSAENFRWCRNKIWINILPHLCSFYWHAYLIGLGWSLQFVNVAFNFLWVWSFVI